MICPGPDRIWLAAGSPVIDDIPVGAVGFRGGSDGGVGLDAVDDSFDDFPVFEHQDDAIAIYQLAGEFLRAGR